MINAVGLQNPGVDKVISEELPKLRKCFGKKVMANVSGFSVDEYAYTCERLDSQEQVGWLEVNVSCPNVHGGGMSFGTDARQRRQRSPGPSRRSRKSRFIIKLSPNVTDIVEHRESLRGRGSGRHKPDKHPARHENRPENKEARDSEHNGRLLRQCDIPRGAEDGLPGLRSAVNIPVVGMGGVSSAEDVIEMMLAGATAVEIGAANLVDPFVCKKIVEALPRVLRTSII